MSRVAEPGGELRGAQHAQRVLLERLGADDVDAAGTDVAHAAIRVDDAVVRDPPRDHVHPEVAPTQVVLERDDRTALDVEFRVTDARRALAARQRDVGFAGRVPELQHGERRTDDIDRADRAQRLQQRRKRHPGHDVVEILRRTLDAVELAPQLVPNAAADRIQRARRKSRLEDVVQRVARHARQFTRQNVPRGTLR